MNELVMNTTQINWLRLIARRLQWKRMGFLSVLAFACLLAAGCASTRVPNGVTAVTPFDIQRYQGTWYEIARLDHSFERGMSDVTATYTPQDDGTLRVINRGYLVEKDQWRDVVGTASFIGDTNTGSLKVSFFGPFYGGYHVAALDTEYRWALVVGPNKGYAWILARDKTLPLATQAAIVQRARALGIDTGAFIWVSQKRPDALPNEQR